MLTGLAYRLLATIYAAGQVFRTDRVNLNTLVGSVCVYLLFGVIWSMAYRFLGVVVPDSFTGLDRYQGSGHSCQIKCTCATIC